MPPQFPSLPSVKGTLNNDSFNVGRKSLMEELTGVVLTVLPR